MTMRILHILPSINPITGGPARSIRLQAAALTRLGHEVHIYTTWWPQPLAEARVPETAGVTVRLFPTSPAPLLGHVPYSSALVRAVSETFDDFDVCHVSSLWNPLASHTMRILRRAGVVYAITCHGMLDPVVFDRNRLAKRAWARLLERPNVEGAALLQFTSEGERDKALRSGWQLPDSVVVPVSVELSTAMDLPPRHTIEERLSKLAGREVILFVGRINWVKNLNLLVDALARLVEVGRDVVLLCVGPDSDGHQAELAARAASLRIAERIIFTGLLQGTDLSAAFARADVLALVSKKENFGQAAAEALVAGVPVVLSTGVDMGKHWPTPPVWRVEPNAVAIAGGLVGALDYSRTSGVPAQAARDLARSEWAEPPVARLAAAYETMAARPPAEKRR